MVSSDIFCPGSSQEPPQKYGPDPTKMLQKNIEWPNVFARRREVAEENHNQGNERMLFHGSPFIQVRTVFIHSSFKHFIHSSMNPIAQKGIEEHISYIWRILINSFINILTD